jgi:hypothetical protein
LRISSLDRKTNFAVKKFQLWVNARDCNMHAFHCGSPKYWLILNRKNQFKIM